MSKTTSSATVTRLSDRSALITGASRGIGFAIAEAFASEGSNIVLSASSEIGLKKAKDKFGSWTLAAASYNRGISGIQRNLNAQKVESYFDLQLGKETSRYVFRILAVKEIMENPSKYGYVFDDNDLYYSVPVRYHGLDTAISNLTIFAEKMGVNHKVLKIHNPWLLQNHLNNKSRKYYQIAIPEKGHY